MAFVGSHFLEATADTFKSLKASQVRKILAHMANNNGTMSTELLNDIGCDTVDFQINLRQGVDATRYQGLIGGCRGFKESLVVAWNNLFDSWKPAETVKNWGEQLVEEFKNDQGIVHDAVNPAPEIIDGSALETNETELAGQPIVGETAILPPAREELAQALHDAWNSPLENAGDELAERKAAVRAVLRQYYEHPDPEVTKHALRDMSTALSQRGNFDPKLEAEIVAVMLHHPNPAVRIQLMLDALNLQHAIATDQHLFDQVVSTLSQDTDSSVRDAYQAHRSDLISKNLGWEKHWPKVAGSPS